MQRATAKEDLSPEFWRSLTDGEKKRLAHSWTTWARSDQIPPDGAWSIWLILTGRGWGKNRTASEWVHEEVDSGRARRIALVARTVPDVRGTVVEGESGILATAKPWNPVTWEPSKRRIAWANGAIATTYSADKPDQLRGPQHDLALADEVASWRYLEAWDQLMFGLRLGDCPRVVAITTPRPIRLIRDLVADPATVVTRGKTYDNLSNLAPLFRQQIIARYEGTRLGRQELDGEIIEDAPGALWHRELLEACRVQQAPEYTRVVVAVDPSGSGNPDADECGLGVAALGTDGHCYVIEDYTKRMSPADWGRKAINLWIEHQADRIVAEKNFGGDMVAQTLRTVRDAADNPVGQNAPIKLVNAARGKYARAEPVAALYEQRRVHHVGALPELEDELCTWEPNKGMRSPNRLDWLVWAVTELMLLNSSDIGITV